MPHDRDAYKIIKCLAIILDTQISTNVTVIRVKLTNGPLLRTALYELSHQHSVSTIIQILSKGLINAAMKPFISPNEEENYTKDFAVWQRNCETYRKAVEELITSSNLSEPDVLVIIK